MQNMNEKSETRDTLQGKCQKMMFFKCQDRYKMTLFKSVIY